MRIKTNQSSSRLSLLQYYLEQRRVSVCQSYWCNTCNVVFWYSYWSSYIGMRRAICTNHSDTDKDSCVFLPGSILSAQSFATLSMPQLDAMYIRRAFRRQGLGRAMLDDVVKETIGAAGTSITDLGVSEPLSDSLYKGNWSSMLSVQCTCVTVNFFITICLLNRKRIDR